MPSIKIAVLGGSNVGKFSLVKSYFNIEHTQDFKALGSDKFEGKFTLENGTIINIIFFIKFGRNLVSDFKHAMKNSDCAILVFDLTNKESLKIVEDYLQSIDRNSPKFQNYLITIFGNKYDDQANRQITDEEGRELAQKYGVDYVPVSAEKKIGLHEGVRYMVQTTYDRKYPNQAANQNP